MNKYSLSYKTAQIRRSIELQLQFVESHESSYQPYNLFIKLQSVLISGRRRTDFFRNLASILKLVRNVLAKIIFPVNANLKADYRVQDTLKW